MRIKLLPELAFKGGRIKALLGVNCNVATGAPMQANRLFYQRESHGVSNRLAKCPAVIGQWEAHP